MPGFDTAATIISDVAREAGLVSSDIANPWASTDEHVLRLVSLLKPTGRELAKALQQSRPKMKVLFTTGYTRNAIVHNGVLDPGTHLLSKPFNIEDLAAKVRSLLDDL